MAAQRAVTCNSSDAPPARPRREGGKEEGDEVEDLVARGQRLLGHVPALPCSTLPALPCMLHSHTTLPTAVHALPALPPPPPVQLPPPLSGTGTGGPAVMGTAGPVGFCVPLPCPRCCPWALLRARQHRGLAAPRSWAGAASSAPTSAPPLPDRQNAEIQGVSERWGGIGERRGGVGWGPVVVLGVGEGMLGGLLRRRRALCLQCCQPLLPSPFSQFPSCCHC